MSCDGPEAKRIFEPRLLLEAHCDPKPGAAGARKQWVFWGQQESNEPTRKKPNETNNAHNCHERLLYQQ